jgi:hypothetical protein
MIRVGANRHVDGFAFADRARMLDSIREQFVHDEPERLRNVTGYSERSSVYGDRLRTLKTV